MATLPNPDVAIGKCDAKLRRAIKTVQSVIVIAANPNKNYTFGVLRGSSQNIFHLRRTECLSVTIEMTQQPLSVCTLLSPPVVPAVRGSTSSVWRTLQLILHGRHHAQTNTRSTLTFMPTHFDEHRAPGRHCTSQPVALLRFTVKRSHKNSTYVHIYHTK